ncbi:MAG: exosortase/archaeosortase family protein [Luteolibacter sp.]
MTSSPSSRELPLAIFAALWVPAMIAASYEWGHGEYYNYGWFVPPAAAWLSFRRWNGLAGPVASPPRWFWLSLLILIPWFTGLRILGYADPSWRLPMGLLGFTAVAVGHAWIAATRGWRVSAGFLWITLLLLSALPWPSVLEAGIVHTFTQNVVTVVSEIFQMLGKPVEVIGDRLQLHRLTVEVTDGCSGVRSFQSFVMATWFFAELQRLHSVRTVFLLVCACAVAFAVNIARTYALAEIRFVKGEEAFHSAHDLLGLLAFFVSGLLFYWISGRLSEAPRRKLVKTVQSR